MGASINNTPTQANIQFNRTLGKLFAIEQYSFIANKLKTNSNELNASLPHKIEPITNETKMAPVIVLMMKFFITNL